MKNKPMFVTEEKRIALISIDGDPATKTGQEEVGCRNVYVRQVGESLSQQGWQVDLFTRHRDAAQPAIVRHNPNCRTIRLAAGPQSVVPRDELFQYLPEFVQQFQLFQQREGWQYPLIHTNHWLSAWAGMELKRNYPLIQVHTYHSLGVLKYQAIEQLSSSQARSTAATRLAVEKACLEIADRVIATSPQEKQHMQTLSCQGHIEMIPCGTDVNRFGSVQRPVARHKLGLAPETKMVLYVGKFSQRKGIETLVRAIAQSHLRASGNLRLVIAGGSDPSQNDSPERDRIQETVAELGLKDITTFPGYLDDADLPVYYAAADVCVVPSYYEPFSPVAVEAMASGTPVVASDVGGLQFTVVPEVTGLLVPPKDEVALGKAIDRILINPNWRDQLGQTGRQRAEIAFSWDSVASSLAHLYTNLLAHSTLSIPEAPKHVHLVA